MTVHILRKKFTVGQYHQMMKSGILIDGDRVELLQGEIIEMSPIGRQHAACVDRVNELLVRELGSRAIVRVQNPIQCIRLPAVADIQPRAGDRVSSLTDNTYA